MNNVTPTLVIAPRKSSRRRASCEQISRKHPPSKTLFHVEVDEGSAVRGGLRSGSTSDWLVGPPRHKRTSSLVGKSGSTRVVISSSTHGIRQILERKEACASLSDRYKMSATAGPSNRAALVGDTDSITSASSGSSQATALASQGNVCSRSEQAMYSNETSRSTDTLKPVIGASSALLTALSSSDPVESKSSTEPEADASTSGQSSPKHFRTLSASCVPSSGTDAGSSSSRSRHVSWHPGPARPNNATIGRAQSEHQLVDIVALGASLQDGIEMKGEGTAGSTWNEGRSTSEISRTPSQSTTGTSKTLSSLDTAASSLQSGGLAHDAKREEADGVESVLPSQAIAPGYASPTRIQDNAEEKREMNTLRRFCALQELVQSESEYLEDLDILVNIFFHHLEQQHFFAGNARRLGTVRRNGSELLELHRKLAGDVTHIMDDCELSDDTGRPAMERARHADEAIIRVAHVLADVAPRLSAYHKFCAMQAEAEQVLSEARSFRNGTDFLAYERICNSLLRSTPRATTPRTAPSSRRTSISTASTSFPGLTQMSNEAEVSELNPSSSGYFASPLSSAPASGATTPSGSVPSFGTSGAVRQAQILRLRFNDYHIKPVQRLCRYSLFLNAIIQFTPADDVITRSALHKAIDRLDDVSTAVDQASLRRQKEVVGETLFTRLERPVELSDELLSSLGAPELIGVADVLYHHPTLHPLRAPFRFNRAGIVLWANFLIFVRVRKNKRLLSQSYFPLQGAILGPLHPEANTLSRSPRPDASRESTPLTQSLRNNFRLSYGNHSFELSARSERERNLWYSAMEMAIGKASSEGAPSLPSSFQDIPDDNASSSAKLEPLYEIAKAQSRTTSSSAKDSTVKFPSASLCAHFDRLMTFSEVFRESTAAVGFAIGTSGGSDNKDIYEAVAAQQARQTPGPSISSTVVGLAKMATTQVPNVIRSRRPSSARQLDAQTLSRMTTATAAKGLQETANGATRRESSTLAPTETGNATYDEAPSNTSTERLGSKIRNSFRRHSTMVQPKRSSTTPALIMSEAGEGRPASDEVRPMGLMASSSGSSPFVLQVETAVNRLRASPHLTPTADGSSPSIAASSGSEGPTSPSFLTPSEEVGEMHLMQSPPILSPAMLENEAVAPQMDAMSISTTSTVGPATVQPSQANVNSRRSSLTATSPARSEKGSISATSSPVQFTSPFRESAARTLRRARSGAWNRLSTFGAPVTMGPSSSTATLVTPSSPSRGRLTRASTDFSPALHASDRDAGLLTPPLRTSTELSPASGSASCSSSTHSASSSRASLSRLRGTLTRSLSMRGKSQPAPAIMNNGGESFSTLGAAFREASGLGLTNINEPSFRGHSRRTSVAESPLLTDSAVKLVSETTRDVAAQTERVDAIPEASFDSVTPANVRDPTSH